MQKQELCIRAPLSEEQLRELLPQIRQWLISWGQKAIQVMYGRGCNLPIDDLWQWTGITTDELMVFINRSESQGIFELGNNDLWIRTPDDQLSFRLCHEADIHFVTADQTKIDEVIAHWRQKGLTLFLSPYEEVQKRRIWTCIEP